ncbi:three component ABC system middle component [Streptomyces virginiae]|uniref:three component ABC system middle component n=1 Tax=Streptomyces virginiae TaxID=1961 RepID=UPI003798B638
MDLSREERALYNPAFTALLCTRAVQGHQKQYDAPCPLTVAVVAAVMALQPSIRTALPGTFRTGLMNWIETNDAVRFAMNRNATPLAAMVRPGLLFALQTRALQATPDGIILAAGATTRAVRGATDQTVAIQNAALFLGRWLPSTGSLSTVLTLLGVKT